MVGFFIFNKFLTYVVNLKITKKIKSLIIFSVLLPVLILIRLLKKFVIIRFKRLRVERIGHQAIETSLYLCYRSWDILPSKYVLDLLYYPKKSDSIVANKFLFKLQKRKIKSLNFNWLVRNLHYFNHAIPGYEDHEMDWPYGKVVDPLFRIVNSAPSLVFKKSEVSKANKLLEENFLCTPKEDIICIFNRDKLYLEREHGFQGTDYSYHDWRDTTIKNYYEAISKCSFVEKYKFFRMGKFVGETIDSSLKNIIDYANSPYRSDFLDIYLMARAKFIICTNTGFGHVGVVFRKKMAIVNLCPILTLLPLLTSEKENAYFDPFGIQNLMIFKKYYSRNLGRILKLSEILGLGAHHFHKMDEYTNRGINLIENTADEIKDLAEEMEMRINNEWKETLEDKELQDKFWDLVGISNKNFNRGFYTKIGTKFLKTNEWILE